MPKFRITLEVTAPRDTTITYVAKMLDVAAAQLQHFDQHCSYIPIHVSKVNEERQ